MNPIHNMHHSDKYQGELDSQPLAHENNLNALYSDLVAAAGSLDAGKFGRKMTGKSYADKCAAVTEALAYIAELDAQTDPRTVMELRSNVISAALKGDNLTANERAELWAELAEIYSWLAKDENQISDYADARTCARFGTQL